MSNDCVTDVPGVSAGHWTHPSGSTGVTVVRFDGGGVAGHHVPGSAVGSREWGTLEPEHLAGQIHAICLAGGSAFGLAAADGVMAALLEAGIGFETGHGRVPIVPAAILFDLDGGPDRPGTDGGRIATEQASTERLDLGAVGAGAGAKVGRGLGQPVPAGVGSASAAASGHTVGAVVAVNAFGSVWDPRDGTPLSHPESSAPMAPPFESRSNTTLAVVATDAPLSKAQCRVVAKMASAAYARCFRPAFTPFDGDVVFAVSTTLGSMGVDPGTLLAVGDCAATTLESAIVKSLRR